ncbi:hypothetical protein [Azospirillum soli]|uniref:hypothetical protein n=1 Tax=Azospirillum soli TaxID=1304799 RepID=UPI001AE22EC5|nr:hypothetical protein [Azospirillum soli]MBP2312015.1 hypothetical protein [Azospirillum soli]
MDIDTAVSVLNELDEAERLLGEIRVHGGVGACREAMNRYRELLNEARLHLDNAHAMA